MNWNKGEDGLDYLIDEGTDTTLRIGKSKPGVTPFWFVESQSFGGSFMRISEGFYSEAAAKADAESIIVHHHRELPALNRRHVVSPLKHTPWGSPQDVTHYGEDVFRYDTPGHGGFHLGASSRKNMPEALKTEDGWYEEDCDWSRVALAFPHLFTTRENAAAVKTARNWLPDEYEAFTGEVIPTKESSIKRERAFKAETADKWVVISALTDDQDRSIVNVYATLGGRRGEGTERRFRVPADEYRQRPEFGFIIDESRHEEIVGASPKP